MVSLLEQQLSELLVFSLAYCGGVSLRISPSTEDVSSSVA